MDDSSNLVLVQYGDAVRYRCFGLFLTGMDFSQISEQTGIDAKVLRKWSREQDWDSERETLRLQAKEVLREDAKFDVVGTQAKHLKNSRRLQDLVEQDLELFADHEGAHFRNIEELTKVLKTAIDIERSAIIGTVEEDFVIKLLQVIKDCVPDMETRQRLSDGIRHLLSSRSPQ